MWSKRKTVKENFKRIGIAYDVNDVISKKVKEIDEEGDVIGDIGDVEVVDIDDYLEKQRQQPQEEGIEELKEKLNVRQLCLVPFPWFNSCL